MKEKDRIANVVNSKFYPLLLFFVSFVFVTLFSRSTSFLYVYEGGDAAVFKQMGLALLRGKTLYVDYFDNKGFLLYFLYALGLWIGSNMGVFALQVVSLSITLLVWDKMLALYRGPRTRLGGIGVLLAVLMCFYASGGQTQEWCLPFISYPLLVFLRAYHSKTGIRPSQMLAIGVCSGVITFIQINNACAFLGFVAYLWFQCLAKKDFRRLFQSVGIFMAGWLTIAVPCVLYFYVKAGWPGVYEMVYASFLSNFEYLGSHIPPNPYFPYLYAAFLTLFTALFVLSAYDRKDILIPSLVSTVLFVASFGKLCAMYYLMAFVPLCVGFLTVAGFSAHRKPKIGLCAALALCLAVYSANPLFHLINDQVLGREREAKIYADFHDCLENIPEAERDSIYNYNLHATGAAMLFHEGLMPCNRVLFTSLVFVLPSLHKEETSKPFEAPKWIMVSFDKYLSDDARFIAARYEWVCSFQHDKLYWDKPTIGENIEISLYRRKD